MKVLFLHKYGPKAASYRYRFEQYFPFLEKHGVECHVHSFFSDNALADKMKSGRFRISTVLSSYKKRLEAVQKIKNYDAVVIYMDAFPYMPYFLENSLLLNKIPYFIDLDDAIFLRYSQSSNPLIRMALKAKFPKIFKKAKGIFAGNSFLAKKAGDSNKNTIILPTVVDLEYYNCQKEFIETGEPLKVGWMGSPSTSIYLKQLQPVFEKLKDKIKLILVGSGPIDLGDVPMEVREWQLKSERQDLLDFDIGIMPLTNDQWSRGKCGFKLIQYMATGIPVIGSPVGVNTDIVENNDVGFLASSSDEWEKFILSFINEPQLLHQLGQAGYEKAKRKFSLETTAPKMLKAIQSVG